MKGNRFLNMKLLLGLCFTIIFTVTLSIASAQSVPDIEWKKCFGGSTNDYAYSIQQTSDGGYIVAGYTYSKDGDVTGIHIPYYGMGFADYWVVKLDTSGDIEWQKCLGGLGGDMAESIQQTSDGGYIVAGRAWSNDGDVTGNHGEDDYWVVKLDTGGDIQWQKCLGGSDRDEAHSIQQTSDGGYIVAGCSWSYDGDVTGNHGTSDHYGNRDYWVVKLDTSGDIEWQKCLGGSDFDEAYSIQQTSDGGYIVAGYTYSKDGDVTGNHLPYYYSRIDDYWVVKLDTSGDIEWQKCLGGSDHDEAHSIQQTSDGGYIVVGCTRSKDGNVTGNHGYIASKDYWVVKLDTGGNIQWQKCLGGSGSDEAYSIQQTSDDGYIVAGYTRSKDGDVTGKYDSGGEDYWVVKLDTSGDIEWQKCLGGSSCDYSESIEQTSDGGYIVAGYTLSDNGSVTGNHGSYDFWIVKFSGDGTVPVIENLVSYSCYTWINWTWTTPSDADFSHTEIYLNGLFQTNTSAEFFNSTGLQPATNYTISTRTVDTHGNINETWVNSTATTKKAGGDDWNPWDDPESKKGELITTSELQEAVYYWLNDISIPETGEELTTERLQKIIDCWLNG